MATSGRDVTIVTVAVAVRRVPSATMSRDDELCEVCVTAPDGDAGWLADLTARLVEERLCACGHLTRQLRSIYRWKGEVQDETEAKVALHTRLALVPAIVAVVAETHPYEVPGIFALPLVGGSPEYLQWVRDETRQGRP